MTSPLKISLLVMALAIGASASVASSPPSKTQTIRVDIKSFAFVPATVNANVGDTIEWINRDFAPHTASDVSGKWTTPSLSNGKGGRITMTVAGTFAYICQFHPQMKGTINVTAAPKAK